MPAPSSSSLSRIPARNRRRAMDWSLVLASQGIEHRIEHTPDTGWALVVAARDSERSFAALRQYRSENPPWPWRRALPQAGGVFDWAGAGWVLLTVVFFWLSQAQPELRELGIVDGGGVARGEVWRLFTATLLHADAAHLAMNAVFGLVLLGVALGRYGTGVGLLAAYLAGACGNVAAWAVYGEGHRGLGASGVVMGALGLVAVQSVSLLRQQPRPWKFVLGGVLGGVMLFVLLGLSEGTDVVAHGGGFVAGLLLGVALAGIPQLAQRLWLNVLAGFGFTAIVLATWGLALTRSG